MHPTSSYGQDLVAVALVKHLFDHALMYDAYQQHRLSCIFFKLSLPQNSLHNTLPPSSCLAIQHPLRSKKSLFSASTLRTAQCTQVRLCVKRPRGRIEPSVFSLKRKWS